MDPLITILFTLYMYLYSNMCYNSLYDNLQLQFCGHRHYNGTSERKQTSHVELSSALLHTWRDIQNAFFQR